MREPRCEESLLLRRRGRLAASTPRKFPNVLLEFCRFGGPTNFCSPCRRSSGHFRKSHVRGHPGAEFALAIIEPHYDAEDLLDPFAHCLHVAWRKLGGAADLLDDT